jgi:hypothetical protein
VAHDEESMPIADASRRMATALVDEVRDADPLLLAVNGIDLVPAFVQVLFTTLRSGTVTHRNRRALVARWGRLPAAAAAGFGGRRPRRGDVLMLVLARVHQQLFASVAEVLAREHPPPLIREIAAGRAGRDRRLGSLPHLARTYLPHSAYGALARIADPWRFPRATRSWTSMVETPNSDIRAAAHDSLLRLAIEAARLDATLAEVRPRLAIAYDEIDAWGRLLAAASRTRGIPSLDLPHAEAVDVAAIRGAAYDVMAVFGPRAANVLAAANVSARVVQVGAARFDGLIHQRKREMTSPLRIVLAGQYLGGSMTEAVSIAVLDAALAAARAIAPSVVQVLPHPMESPARWERLLGSRPPPRGVDARVEREAELQSLLPGAAMLVTGWSNSVYEATLSGVPSITVHVLGGAAPMPFAEEGIAVEARTPSQAADLGARLIDPMAREQLLTGATAALQQHLGPIDGRATERTAKVVSELLASGPP